MAGTFDRTAEDVGNIVALEHVNVCVPDQRLATLFYVTGLGLTRDPYLVTGVTNMWINVGRSQFHLPTGEAQRLRGTVGLVSPDLGGLCARLADVRASLAGTAFGFTPANDHIDATCPWGNRFRVHAPGGRFGRTALGMPYVRLDVPRGTAAGIARFYGAVFGAPATVADDDAPTARIGVGGGQTLEFRETDAPAAPYDGHHIQVYVADFSGPYRRLGERGLISKEDNQHQYRFRDIVDETTGAVLFTLEHEIRAMTHPLYGRPLVNRNPDQTNVAYVPGHEERGWAIAGPG